MIAVIDLSLVHCSSYHQYLMVKSMKFHRTCIIVIFYLVFIHVTESYRHISRIQVIPGKHFNLQALSKHNEALGSSIALISGTTVGAGILALPVLAAPSGFIPSTITLVLAYGIMCSTGILIAESCCNLRQKNLSSFNEDVTTGIISITSQVLGKSGSVVSSVVYAMNNFILLTAYIAQAGTILNNAFNLSEKYTGPLVYSVVMGLFMAFSPKAWIELLNNSLFAVLLIVFASLLVIGIGEINIPNLFYSNYSMILSAFPVMLLALVYHNIVPTICSQLDYNRENIVKAIIVGTLIPLLMFICWDGVILGIGLPETIDNVADIASGVSEAGPPNYDPVAVLERGRHLDQGVDYTSVAVNAFGMSAITTSFIGFIISSVDFYKELLANYMNDSSSDKWLYAFSIAPPLVVAITDPSVFLNALDYAGTYGVSILFGILPIIIAYRLR
jgi:tyrosine-specific transport protein